MLEIHKNWPSGCQSSFNTHCGSPHKKFMLPCRSCELQCIPFFAKAIFHCTVEVTFLQGLVGLCDNSISYGRILMKPLKGRL